MPPRSCPCGGVHAKGQRCPNTVNAGTTTQRGLGHAYQVAAAQCLAEEDTCWLCGGDPTPSDPLTADHVVPRCCGGSHHRSNLRAAHKSCNSSRGAQHICPFRFARPAKRTKAPRRGENYSRSRGL